MPLGLSLILLVLAAGCRPAAQRQAPPQTPVVQADQRESQRLALRRCHERRRVLLEGLQELRRVEAELAGLRQAVQTSPGPSRPVWDEEKEQRFSLEDQQLDRQRYDQELAAWQQRQEAWRQRHRDPLAQAQQRLDRQTRLLHSRYPSLFTGPGSIEIKPQELDRLSHCPAGPH